MRTVQMIARALAWFNLIFWGIPIVSSLFQSLTTPNPLILVVLVLCASIPLQSFASLQLHRSIRHPEVKLSHQTPVGIRFVGVAALCIGILFASMGAIVLGNAKEMLPLYKEQMADLKEMSTVLTVGGLQRVGALFLVLGLAVIASVVLNMRLLRWYNLVKQSDVS